ncbi:hypothetical protein AVEN_177345-1 [Araneus ventricosus]|uniref:Uncharacterized protein n=1 Tax=Araneus ventricosus TaxID=182803 RepID=A0A4Y2QH47_ARAVE|nr:hypothetical protein AVEN_177345-1 [Araneus ventricosus]
MGATNESAYADAPVEMSGDSSPEKTWKRNEILEPGGEKFLGFQPVQRIQSYALWLAKEKLLYQQDSEMSFIQGIPEAWKIQIRCNGLPLAKFPRKVSRGGLIVDLKKGAIPTEFLNVELQNPRPSTKELLAAG